TTKTRKRRLLADDSSDAACDVSELSVAGPLPVGSDEPCAVAPDGRGAASGFCRQLNGRRKLLPSPSVTTCSGASRSCDTSNTARANPSAFTVTPYVPGGKRAKTTCPSGPDVNVKCSSPTES